MRGSGKCHVGRLQTAQNHLVSHGTTERSASQGRFSHEVTPHMRGGEGKRKRRGREALRWTTLTPSGSQQSVKTWRKTHLLKVERLMRLMMSQGRDGIIVSVGMFIVNGKHVKMCVMLLIMLASIKKEKKCLVGKWLMNFSPYYLFFNNICLSCLISKFCVLIHHNLLLYLLQGSLSLK